MSRNRSRCDSQDGRHDLHFLVINIFPPFTIDRLWNAKYFENCQFYDDMITLHLIHFK